MIAEIKKSSKRSGDITISGSKSISNRLLIIQHLSDNHFEINNLSTSRDTIVLHSLLNNKGGVFYAEDGGTTSRFLLPLLCLMDGEQKLTASDQLSKRPIEPLVNALAELGAIIEYQENKGELPLLVKSSELRGGKISVRGDVSSQFISALMLIAPYLRGGLNIELETDLVSSSYVTLTSDLMIKFGAEVSWKENRIIIHEGSYKSPSAEYIVEGDWSSASFFIALGAVLENCKLRLIGLDPGSSQGDRKIVDILNSKWISVDHSGSTLDLKNIDTTLGSEELIDLKSTPDLFPPLAACYALNNTNVTFSGLTHLVYKESDRFGSMKTELKKVACEIRREDDKIVLETKNDDLNRDIAFNAHQDHRIAMACALFAVKYRSVRIHDAEVVKKSNGDFWTQLGSIGFDVRLLPD
ncbi:MAG: hypothetical protein HKN92_06755 [Chitinophagales bacterium]|nr:hypothetical protein [Chitinophagales bacterium]